MCGIAGIAGTENDDSRFQRLRSMAKALEHRGPDGQGFYEENAVALTHTRLSIIDLSERASQPMSSADGRYVLTYNGELYNYRQIRSELENHGHTFVSQSDTEVVLQALTRWGNSALAKFNGMFALGLWDRQMQCLLLARDRFGIKPLYYSTSKQEFAFGSEIKALVAAGHNIGQVSQQGLMEYLFYGTSHAPETLYVNFKKLLPGTYLTLKPGQAPQVSAFYELTGIEKTNPTRGEAIEQIRHLLNAAVERHLVADVPVGLFLSGGLDSSTLCALASKHYQGQLNTWSVEFEGQTANSELAIAQEVAKAYGTKHHEIHLDYRSLEQCMETMVDCHDGPFGDAANIPLYLMSGNLGSNMKVVLQGDGGDEIFGGYSRYRWLQHKQRWRLLSTMHQIINKLPSQHRHVKRILRLAEAFGSKEGAVRSAKLLTEEVSEQSVYGLLKPEIANELAAHDPFLRYRQLWPMVGELPASQAMLWLDSQILLPDAFLEKVDRATMANSIEVRVPFLDTELCDYVMGLPASLKLQGRSKSLLREAMVPVLPNSVINGQKLGFGVPYGEWLRGPLHDFTRDNLLSGQGLMGQLFQPGQLQDLCDNHRKGQGHRGFMLYKLLMLALWSKKTGMAL